MVAAGLFLSVQMSVKAMEDTEQVKQMRLELQQAEKRAGRLKAMLDRMENRAKRMTEELHRLVGGPWDRYGGQIQQMRSNLVVAESIQHDASKRQVVFTRPPTVYGGAFGGGPDVYVVDKVTAVLVFIRKIGSTRQERYTKDGTGVASGEYTGAIDIAATFPEGVDNFKP